MVHELGFNAAGITCAKRIRIETYIERVCQTQSQAKGLKRRDPTARLASTSRSAHRILDLRTCNDEERSGAGPGRCEERWKMKVDMDGQTLDQGGPSKWLYHFEDYGK